MINIQLVPQKQGQDKLILAFDHSFRYFFYIPAVFFFTMLLMDDKNTGSNIGPMIIVGILFLSGSYHEKWIFDRPKKSVEHQVGLMFLFRRTKFSMDEIRSVKLIGIFRKGQNGVEIEKRRFTVPSSLIKLLIDKNDGMSFNVEMVKTKNMGALQKKAELIASFCEVSLFTTET